MNIMYISMRYTIVASLIINLAFPLNIHAKRVRQQNLIAQALQQDTPLIPEVKDTPNVQQSASVQTTSSPETSPETPKKITKPSQLPQPAPVETTVLPQQSSTLPKPTQLQPPATQQPPKVQKNDVPLSQQRALDQLPLVLPQELQTKPTIDEEAAKNALGVLAPPIEEEPTIEFNFENADMQNLIKQIEEIFHVTFITDEAIQPLKQGSKQIKGNKITFQTHMPLSKKKAWDLFITFLEISGFTVVPHNQPNIYRIQTLESSLKAPVPAFIGVHYPTLPDNDEIIRYVYFIENSTPDAIKAIIDPLRSSTSSLIILQEHKAFILTDKAYNIKILMSIIKELDKVTMPQALSVLKLRRVDAQQVKQLYDSLIQAEDKNQPRFIGMPRKQPTSLFFPENIKLIAEPRTNALILLGPQDAIKKIEDFIIKYIDIELDQVPSPLHTIKLKFADAATIADIMNNVTQFGQNTPAGQSGGVRGEDKYLRSMSFTPEKETNKIIVKGNYEDFLMAKDIIEKLDAAQPQVAIEVLILSIKVVDKKELGVQLRSKDHSALDNFIGNNVKFQTSGLFAGGSAKGIVENPTGLGVQRLLGNLLNLVTAAGPANTIITLGQDIFGVWGILQLLQQLTNTQIISNPFIIATNKSEASVSIGETRRVITGTVVGTSTESAFGSDQALLSVKITPQINSDGFIILDLIVDITEFTTTNPTDATKTTKKIVTKTIVADKEVLALGGLIRNKVSDSLSKTPVLGDIPILGWLFKNKSKEDSKESLLILLSTRIINPQETAAVMQFTQDRLDDYYGTMHQMTDVAERRDPIHRMFFENPKSPRIFEDFVLKSGQYQRKIKRKKKRDGPTITQAEQASMPPEKKSLNTPAPITEVAFTQPAHSSIKGKKRKQKSLANFLSQGEQA